MFTVSELAFYFTKKFSFDIKIVFNLSLNFFKQSITSDNSIKNNKLVNQMEIQC